MGSPLNNRVRLPALLLALAVLAGMAVGSGAQAPAQDGRLATVTLTIQTVEVQAAGEGEWVAVQAPHPLFMHDRIRTLANSRAVVVFTDASQVRLNAETTLEIAPRTLPEEPRGVAARVRVFLGQVLNRVNPQESNLEFQSPDAVAAVRGTTFGMRVGVVGPPPDLSVLGQVSFDTWSQMHTFETRLGVLVGLVHFFNPLGEVEVGESQVSQSRSDLAPSEPVTLDPEAVRQELDWEGEEAAAEQETAQEEAEEGAEGEAEEAAEDAEERGEEQAEQEATRTGGEGAAAGDPPAPATTASVDTQVPRDGRSDTLAQFLAARAQAAAQEIQAPPVQVVTAPEQGVTVPTPPPAAQTTPPPVITKLVPQQATNVVDRTIAVHGGNFVNVTGVRLGKRSLDFRVVDHGLLLATVPAGTPPGAYGLVVATASGTTAPREYRVLPPAPIITSLTPDWVLGGTAATVELTGQHFLFVRTVWIGGQAVSPTVVSPTLLTATVPSDIGPGTWSVVVQTESGNSQALSLTVRSDVQWAEPLDADRTIFSPALDGESVTWEGILPVALSWRLSVRDAQGVTVREWTGSGTSVRATWDGRSGASGLIVPDGVYSPVVAVSHAAGFSQEFSGAGVTVDATPPGLQLQSPSSGQHVRGVIAIDGRVSEANLDGWALIVDGVELASGTGQAVQATLDTRGLPDGSHTITLAAVDLAGNASDVAAAVIVDNTDPVAAISVPQSGDYVRGTVAIEGSATDTNLLQWTLRVGEQQVASGTTAQVSAILNTVALGLPDETYTLGLTVTDRAGNTAANSITVVVDNTAPRLTSILRHDPLVELTNADTLVFRVSFDEAVTGVDAADFAVTGPTGATLAVTAVSGSGYDVTVSGGDLAGLDGTVSLAPVAQPTIQDLAGNLLADTAAVGDVQSYTVDNTAPAIAVEPLGSEWIGEGEVTVSISDNLSGLAFTAYAWSASASPPPAGSPAWTEFGQLEGETLTQTETGLWYLHVRAADVAGNVETVSSGTYALLPAGIHLHLNVGWSYPGLSTPIQILADAESLPDVVSLNVGERPLSFSVQILGSSLLVISADVPGDLAPGTYGIVIGTPLGSTEPLPFVVRTVPGAAQPPVAGQTRFSPGFDDPATWLLFMALLATDEADTPWRFQVIDQHGVHGTPGTVVFVAEGVGPQVAVTWDGRDPDGQVVGEGDYTPQLHVLDALGRVAVGGTYTGAPFTVEKVATTLAAMDRTVTFSGQATLSATLTRTTDGAGVAGKSVEFKVAGSVVGTGITNASGVATTTYTPDLAAGDYSIEANFAGDDAYLPSSDEATLTVNNPVPAIAALSPASVARLGTVDITVTGGNFIAGVTTVDFGAGVTINSVTVNSGTELVANVTVAVGAELGARTVAVANAQPGGGEALLEDGLAIINPVPIVETMSPIEGARLTTLNLTITGTNFIAGVTTVDFGEDITVNRLTVESATQLKVNVTVTANAATGDRSVTVANIEPGGGNSNALTFTVLNPLPIASGMTPENLVIERLETVEVTVSGANFLAGVTTVEISGAGVTVGAVTVTGATSLTVSLTAAADAPLTARHLTVRNPAPGGGSATLQDALSVRNPVPVLTSLDVTEVEAGAAGFTLTLTGSKFVVDSAVRVGDTPDTGRATTFVSSTVLQVEIPADDLRSTGTLGVRVFNAAPGGGTSEILTLTVIPSSEGVQAPDRVGVAPASIDLSQTATLTVTLNQNGRWATVVVEHLGSSFRKLWASEKAPSDSKTVTVAISGESLFESTGAGLHKVYVTETDEKLTSHAQVDFEKTKSVELTLAPAGVYWVGGSGHWHDASKWVNGTLPGASHDVFISVPGNVTITHSQGEHAIKSLRTREAIDATGGKLAINGLSTFDGPLTVNGGIVRLGGATTLNKDVTLTSGTLEIGANVTINGSLVVAGGALQVDESATLTVNGAFTWTGGTLSGAGNVLLNSTSIVSGSSSKSLSQIHVTNEGSATWTDGTIQAEGGATFINAAGATFNIRSNASFTQAGERAVFANAGIVTKSQSTGTTAFTVGFENGGTVSVNTGILSLNAGGEHTGDFVMAQNAILRIAGGEHVLKEAATVTGPGTLEISAGEIRFNTATETASTINLKGGALSGTENLTVLGSLHWTGGSLQGAGLLVIGAAANLTIESASTLSLARTTHNLGTTTWRQGAVEISGNAAIRNLAGGTFDAQTDATLSRTSGSTAVLRNEGTLVKSAGTGTTYLAIPVHNDGTVRVETGILRVGLDSQGAGQFLAQGSATLEFSGENHQLQTGSSVAGLGTVLFSGGIAEVQGTYDVEGTTVVKSGAEVRFLEGATTTNLGAALVIAGAVEFRKNVTTDAKIEFSDGRIGGSGALRVTGSLAWKGGKMDGEGRTIVDQQGVLTIEPHPGSPAIPVTLERSLENEGLLIWIGGQVHVKAQGVVVTNKPGATFEIRTEKSFLKEPGQVTSEFRNEGTVVKTAGAGVTRFEVPFRNSGSVEVQVGTLTLSEGGSSAGGSFQVGTGATVQFDFSARTYAFTGTSRFLGQGTVVLRNGVFEVNEGGELVASSTVDVQGGTLTGSGHLKIEPAGTLLINVNQRLDLELPTRNAGKIAWNKGDVTLGAGVTLTNAAGGFFEVKLNNKSFTGGSGSVFRNEGILVKTGSGAGQGLEIGVDFQNASSGSVAVDAGTLRLTGGSTGMAGVLEVATGAKLVLTGTYQLSDEPVELRGEGTVEFEGALEGAGELKVAGNLLWKGSLSGALDVTIQGSLQWIGGTLSGTGRIIVESSGELIIDQQGAGLHGSVENRGMIIWKRGDISPSGPGVLLHNVEGAFFVIAITQGNNLSFNSGATIINQGAVIKTTASNVTFRSWFTNEGVIAVHVGLLEFTALTNWNSGAKTLTGGTYRVFTGTELRISNANIERNEARLELFGTAKIGSKQGGGKDSSALRNFKTNGPRGTIVLGGGHTLKVDESLTNEGHLTVEQGSTLDVAGDFVNHGRIVIGQNSTFAVGRSVDNKEVGDIVVTAGSTMTVVENLSNKGHLEAGYASTVTVGKSYDQVPEGILTIGIHVPQGESPQPQLGLLDVRQDVKLRSLLIVALTTEGAASLGLGDEFLVIKAGEKVDDKFGDVISVNAGDNGVVFAAVYSPLVAPKQVSLLVVQTSALALTSIPDPPLVKQASVPVAQIGHVITYTITFDNTRLINDEVALVDHNNVWIRDVLPLGFIYVPGSSYVYPEGVGGARPPVQVSDPAGSRILYWELTSPAAGGRIEAFETRTLSYQVIVGPRVVEGATYTNQALGFADQNANGQFDPGVDAALTNVARADVRVTGGVFTPRAVAVGKVYRDLNGNGRQDPGEPGVGGVRIRTETGVSVITDSEGKFSIGNLTPRQHVFKLDARTLPEGWRAGQPGETRLIEMALGGLFTVNFPLEEGR